MIASCDPESSSSAHSADTPPNRTSDHVQRDKASANGDSGGKSWCRSDGKRRVQSLLSGAVSMNSLLQEVICSQLGHSADEGHALAVASGGRASAPGIAKERLSVITTCAKLLQHAMRNGSLSPREVFDHAVHLQRRIAAANRDGGSTERCLPDSTKVILVELLCSAVESTNSFENTTARASTAVELLKATERLLKSMRLERAEQFSERVIALMTKQVEAAVDTQRFRQRISMLRHAPPQDVRQFLGATALVNVSFALAQTNIAKLSRKSPRKTAFAAKSSSDTVPGVAEAGSVPSQTDLPMNHRPGQQVDSALEHEPSSNTSSNQHISHEAAKHDKAAHSIASPHAGGSADRSSEQERAQTAAEDEELGITLRHVMQLVLPPLEIPSLTKQGLQASRKPAYSQETDTTIEMCLLDILDLLAAACSYLWLLGCARFESTPSCAFAFTSWRTGGDGMSREQGLVHDSNPVPLSEYLPLEAAETPWPWTARRSVRDNPPPPPPSFHRANHHDSLLLDTVQGRRHSMPDQLALTQSERRARKSDDVRSTHRMRSSRQSSCCDQQSCGSESGHNSSSHRRRRSHGSSSSSHKSRLHGSSSSSNISGTCKESKPKQKDDAESTRIKREKKKKKRAEPVMPEVTRGHDLAQSELRRRRRSSEHSSSVEGRRSSAGSNAHHNTSKWLSGNTCYPQQVESPSVVVQGSAHKSSSSRRPHSFTSAPLSTDKHERVSWLSCAVVEQRTAKCIEYVNKVLGIMLPLVLNPDRSHPGRAEHNAGHLSTSRTSDGQIAAEKNAEMSECNHQHQQQMHDKLTSSASTEPPRRRHSSPESITSPHESLTGSLTPESSEIASKFQPANLETEENAEASGEVPEKPTLSQSDELSAAGGASDDSSSGDDEPFPNPPATCSLPDKGSEDLSEWQQRVRRKRAAVRAQIAAEKEDKDEQDHAASKSATARQEAKAAKDQLHNRLQIILLRANSSQPWSLASQTKMAVGLLDGYTSICQGDYVAAKACLEMLRAKVQVLHANGHGLSLRLERLALLLTVLVWSRTQTTLQDTAGVD